MKSIAMKTPSQFLPGAGTLEPRIAFPRLKSGLRFALFSVLATAHFLPESEVYADTGNFVNDQIAAHFEQVFGDGGESERRRQGSWLPGADEDGLLWGYESRLELSGTWISPAKIRNTDSKADVSFMHATYGIAIPVGPRTQLGFVSTASRYHVSESGSSLLDAVFDYDHIWQWDAGFITTFQLNPRWALFTGAMGIVSGGGGGDVLETHLNGMAFLGAMLTVNPDLVIALGASTSTATELDSRSVPMLLVDWRIGNKTRLSIRNGLFFDYALSSDWRHVVGIGVEGSQWTVGLKDQTSEYHKKHYLVANDTALNLKFVHRFGQGLSFGTKVGLFRYGCHTIYEDSRELSKREFESSIGFTMGLHYRF